MSTIKKGSSDEGLRPVIVQVINQAHEELMKKEERIRWVDPSGYPHAVRCSGPLRAASTVIGTEALWSVAGI
jgi:hypothetical protein